MSHTITLTLIFIVFVYSSKPVEAQHDEALTSPAEAQWSVENLGSVINSPYHDAFPTISLDGLSLYFASDRASYSKGDSLRPWYDTYFDIYVSSRESLNDPWPSPVRLPSHINTSGDDHSVSFSTDGHWLYFSSDSLKGYGKFDIFRAYREDTKNDLSWGTPENLGSVINGPAHDVCEIYYDEGDGVISLYFVSNRTGPDALGSFDVYMCKWDSVKGFGPPAVVEILSSEAFDGHFDPHAGFLWTMRDGGLGGSDLWFSSKNSEGEWEEPINLGSPINTEYEEQMPSPYDHGKVLYFPSDRPGGSGGLDIYVGNRLN